MNMQNTTPVNQDEFLELLKKIEEENAGQERYAKKQYQMARISAAASVVILFIVLACVALLMPQLMQTFAQINIVMTDLNAITSVLAQSLPEMMEELSVIIEELSGMIGEMPDMIRELDVLMETSGEGISNLLFCKSMSFVYPFVVRRFSFEVP